jgi:hypothetical protein
MEIFFCRIACPYRGEISLKLRRIKIMGHVKIRVIHAVRIKNEMGNGMIAADINVFFF